jgi:hypothetical protein
MYIQLTLLIGTPEITIQPLRKPDGSLVYHIDVRLAGCDTIVLAPTLESVLPVTFEHMQDLVESALVSPPLTPYHITFKGEAEAEAEPNISK